MLLVNPSRLLGQHVVFTGFQESRGNQLCLRHEAKVPSGSAVPAQDFARKQRHTPDE